MFRILTLVKRFQTIFSCWERYFEVALNISSAYCDVTKACIVNQVRKYSVGSKRTSSLLIKVKVTPEI